MHTATARTDTAAQRSAIYERLRERNRLVAVLRVGLPVIGAIIFLGFVLQFYFGSLVPNFGFANITIDRDNLVVETPSYSSVGSDGTVFSIGAAKARAAIGDTDLIQLMGATFELKQPGGSSFSATAESARMRLSEQVVLVDGPTAIVSSAGITGTVNDAEVEIGGERLRKAGAANLKFEGGSTLTSETMSFDGKTSVWRFGKVTLRLVTTPGETAADTTDTEPVALRPGAQLTAAPEATP